MTESRGHSLDERDGVREVLGRSLSALGVVRLHAVCQRRSLELVAVTLTS